MTFDQLLFQILNHPLVWAVLIITPTFFILRRYITDKFDFITKRDKAQSKDSWKADSIATKIKLATDNPELAYEKLSKDIKEATVMINSSDPKLKALGTSKKKDAEFQLKAVQWMLENKTYVDYGKDMIIPLIEGFEKKARTYAKGFFGQMGI